MPSVFTTARPEVLPQETLRRHRGGIIEMPDTYETGGIYF